MDSDVPKMKGLFQAFKSSIAKSKRANPQPKQNKINGLKILSGLDYLCREDAISRLDITLSAIDFRDLHIQNLTTILNKHILITQAFFDKVVNTYISLNAFSLSGVLKLTARSDALSIFKKLKEITLAVLFTSTRNFSIQKNLSISA
ncbi:hypothetical protein M5F04_10595 [Acinetobacter sp. ANC 7200]|uniref:hypothetical protein n=1 Tax=Acinetobacter amyesii TaxID=2942470 RepID=UPI0020BF35B4|nr:hypothetical protein [Acinetobacter amyesii]MCL6244989.1 hypothetical protein [Acinetobacter amyesii]